MYLLTVRCYGDFDEPYDENICCSEDKIKLKEIQLILNQCCANHPKVDLDYRVYDELTQLNFYHALSNNIGENISMQIYPVIEEICKHNCVYIYDDIFDIKEILTV